MIEIKEPESIHQNDEAVSNRVVTNTYNVINENGILRFTDWAHYENVINILKDLHEEHLDNFDASYPNLTNDELDDKEDEIGFEYYLPFIEFENQLNFSSLRASVELQILDWLDNTELDLSRSPNKLAGHSLEVRTLLNEAYQVKIGSQIIDLTPLNNLTDNSEELQTRMPCWSFRKKTYDDDYDNNNKMYEVLLEYDSWPFVMKTHAEITHFKRRNNGKWRRSRANMTIDVAGRMRREDCSGNGNYYKKRDKKRRSLDVRVHRFTGRQVRAMDNEIVSNYTVGNIISEAIVLN